MWVRWGTEKCEKRGLTYIHRGSLGKVGQTSAHVYAKIQSITIERTTRAEGSDPKVSIGTTKFTIFLERVLHPAIVPAEEWTNKTYMM